MRRSLFPFVLAALLAWLLAAFALFAGPASAASGTNCSWTQSEGINTSTSPNVFVAIGKTNCFPPNPTHPMLDDLGVVVFWDYVEWHFTYGVWRPGGLYDLADCGFCAQLVSRTNDHVPIGAYLGINCRRAQVVHRMMEYLTDRSTWDYRQYTLAQQCQ